MIKKIFLRIIFIIFSLISLVSVSNGSDITFETIIEGESIAGLRIGDSEDKILRVISNSSLELIYAEKYTENEKLVSFGNMTEEGGLGINVFLSNGKIMNIDIVSAPVKGKHFYYGKTKKGFAFGDSFEVVEKLYGEPYKKWGEIYWYKDEGIMFGAVGHTERPNQITIMSPGSELSSFIKEMGLH